MLRAKVLEIEKKQLRGKTRTEVGCYGRLETMREANRTVLYVRGTFSEHQEAKYQNEILELPEQFELEIYKQVIKECGKNIYGNKALEDSTYESMRNGLVGEEIPVIVEGIEEIGEELYARIKLDVYFASQSSDMFTGLVKLKRGKLVNCIN